MVTTITPHNQGASSRIAVRLMMNGIDFEIKGNTIEAVGNFDKTMRAVGVDGSVTDLVDYALHSGEIMR